MIVTEPSAARAAAARAVLRLLTGLARRSDARGSNSIGQAESAAFELAKTRGWVERDQAGGGWTLSATGRLVLRRALSGQDLSEADAACTGGRRPPPSAVAIEADESPLAWLRRRKGRDGQPLISEDEFQAGERLRSDFWFAGMTPRVTSRWGEGPTSGGRRAAPGTGVEVRDGVIAAESRVRKALAAVGPELCGVLIDVCCHLKGIEDAERQAGWPQRSGKIVLRIALAQLARHYGIGTAVPANAGSARIRHWGAPDYRPALDDGPA